MKQKEIDELSRFKERATLKIEFLRRKEHASETDSFSALTKKKRKREKRKKRGKLQKSHLYEKEIHKTALCLLCLLLRKEQYICLFVVKA